VDGSGSIVAERLAALAFTHLDRLLARAIALVDGNGMLVRDFLRSRADLTWIEPGGTVVFPRLRGVTDTTRFTERLLKERDTAIVPGHFFQAPAHVRIGFAGPTDALRSGLEAIGAALDEGVA
jgi:aspartate/methionine/tyrosine aminotransferase